MACRIERKFVKCVQGAKKARLFEQIRTGGIPSYLGEYRLFYCEHLVKVCLKSSFLERYLLGEGACSLTTGRRGHSPRFPA